MGNKKEEIKFINYDGAYPNLCSGVLILKINGEVVEFPPFSLSSGGCAGVNDRYEEYCTQGPWSVNIPDEYKKYEKEITDIVNANIPWGCCGGCI